jgi:predicted amidohydrolase
MNKSASLLRVAALQTPLVWENPTANAEAIGRQVDALEKPCDLIVLPEMWATGFTMDPSAHASVLPSGWQDDEAAWPAPLAEMRKWARERDAAVIGSLSCRDETLARPVNRCFFVPPSGPVECYDKRHLFSFAGEDAAYGPGEKRVIVEWRGWRILLQVCYDLRFPVFSRNRSEDRYDAAVYVANWPAARVGAWSSLLVARAIENQCYVVGVNRVGADGKGIEHSGGSALIDPYGRTRSELDADASGWIHGDWDRAELNRYRVKFPVLGDADSFELL